MNRMISHMIAIYTLLHQHLSVPISFYIPAPAVRGHHHLNVVRFRVWCASSSLTSRILTLPWLLLKQPRQHPLTFPKVRLP